MNFSSLLCHLVPSSSTAHAVPRHSSQGPSVAFKAKENVFWHTLQETPPPGNWTPGLIPLLKRTFTKLHSRGITARAVLCTDGVCHVGTEFCASLLDHCNGPALTHAVSRLGLGLRVRL
jgi:hypothetical protein